MTPIEALELYFESHKLEPARKAKLMQYARELLNEDEMSPEPVEPGGLPS